MEYENNEKFFAVGYYFTALTCLLILAFGISYTRVTEDIVASVLILILAAICSNIYIEWEIPSKCQNKIVLLTKSYDPKAYRKQQTINAINRILKKWNQFNSEKLKVFASFQGCFFEIF